MNLPGNRNSRLISGTANLRLWQKRAGAVSRVFARPVVRAAREVPVWVNALAETRGRGPLVVFLPAYGRQGAALLRIYHVAVALREHGWRSLVLPGTLTLSQRRRLLRAVQPELVVMQGARHALNRPEFYPHAPILYDMDDADFHLPHLRAAVECAMPDVSAVIAGSSYVADWCLGAGAKEAHVVWTGAPISVGPKTPQRDRAPVLAWAQTRPMTYLREADLVRVFTRTLASRCPGLRLRLFDRQPGDDPGFARSFEAPGLAVEWYNKLGYSDYLEAMDDVSLGLAPLCPETPFSRGKSFGKVLAYLDAEVPVLASDACEHGAFFQPGTGVVSNDPDDWLTAAEHLLKDGQARQAMADAAKERFRQCLSLQAATQKIDAVLRQYLT